jgi:catechol 1,2-dioxygenase
VRTLTEQNLTEAVLNRLEGCADPRLRQVVGALVRHLHGFIREIEPTPEEWLTGIRFLTETGQLCDDKRQEFILMSDTLGVTMLVDAINNRKPAGATESSVLGPFYVQGAPERDNGADLAPADGDRVTVSGRVRGVDGQPIPDALLDIWQTAPNGYYHVQDAELPPFHLCGRIHADDQGRYRFTTLRPVSYPVPTDGPVGRMLKRLGRHPYRPAHIHFIVSAPHYKPVVTQLFSEGDPYLESDAVFGVKASLVVDYTAPEAGGSASGNRTRATTYDFVLEPAAQP